MATTRPFEFAPKEGFIVTHFLTVADVCGKGLHSGLEGPVLPDVVIERLSEELAQHVLAFCTAPRRWGGSGALLVMLRPPVREGE